MILIATDKFKGTLTAPEATEIIRDAFARCFPDEEVVAIPVADGGEGTARVIASLMGMKRFTLPGQNVAGKPVTAEYYADGRGRVALDSATVLGLTLVDEADRDPMRLSSAPLGRLISDIISVESPSEIILGVGGTATSDGGAGMIQALGATLVGIDSVASPAVFGNIDRVDLSTMITLPAMRLLCDVDVPLVGKGDAPSAMTFAPQKGLRDEDRDALRRAMSRWSRLTGTDAPFSGAGGGLISALITKFIPEYGADVILDLAGVDSMTTRLVITGEGCIDAQSVMGKITGRLARYARSRGATLIGVGGRVEPSPALDGVFDALYSTLSGTDPSADAVTRLSETASRAAADLSRSL